MNLVPDFKNTLFNDNVKDIALDFSEMGIDAAINNDILAEVPIAKSIVAFCKTDRKSTRLNSSHPLSSRMPSSA